MDAKDVDRLAKAYLKYTLAETEKEKEDIFNNEVYEIDKIQYESPDDLWLIILRIYNITDDSRVLTLLSAGFLENLLAQFPYQSINWVEEQAKKDPRFKKLLHGVWQNIMPDEIWERIQKIRAQKE
jgi:hypothetical protein